MTDPTAWVGDAWAALVGRRSLCTCACSGPGRWPAYAVAREPFFPSADKQRVRLKAAGLYDPAHVAAHVRAGARLRTLAAPAA